MVEERASVPGASVRVSGQICVTSSRMSVVLGTDWGQEVPDYSVRLYARQSEPGGPFPA
jgi:hypothetical protein